MKKVLFCLFVACLLAIMFTSCAGEKGCAATHGMSGYGH